MTQCASDTIVQIFEPFSVSPHNPSIPCSLCVPPQATSVENRVVDRARAWCGSLAIPYLRCSPQLTLNLLLDETRNEQLRLILWESRVYLESRRDTLRDFVKLL